MSSHRVHTRPAHRAGHAAAVPTSGVSTDVTSFLEDAAHFPGGHAHGVAQPQSESDVARLVRTERRLLAVGAQSSLTGGATPMGETVVSTDRMNQVLSVGAARITVQAGVSIRHIQEQAAAQGAHYPPVPTFDGAAAGGVVATNAAGAATFKYGSTRDWVRALTVVLPTGDVLELERGETSAHPDGYFELVGEHTTCRVPVPTYRMPDVAKRSAGYFAKPGMDLIDLFIGSEGTLGIVTSATFRLLPRVPNTCLLWVTFPDEQTALDLVTALRDEARETWRSANPRGIDVAAVEHLDRRSLELLREDGADRRYGVSVPEDAMVALLVQVELPGEVPVSPQDAYDQIANALGGNAPDTPLTRLSRLIDGFGALDRVEIALPQDRKRQRQLIELREAVPEAVNNRVRAAQQRSPHIYKTAADMIVPFDRFDESLRVYRSAFDQRGLDYAIWGHISDGNVHPNVIPRDMGDVGLGQQAILECGRQVIALGGCPLAEHGVGRNPVKQALLQELYGEPGIEQMRRVKSALDPDWRLAPGVLFPKTGSSMSRFLAHWLTTAVALGVASWILPGVTVTSLTALMIAALVLGFVNAVVKPVLVLLTLPFTLVTLGLFYFVVNGLAFGIAAWLVPGFGVRSFTWAILGAFIVGMVSWFIGGFRTDAPWLGRRDPTPVARRGEPDRRQSLTRRRRSALAITDNELIVIATLAHIGLMSSPTTGYSKPAATGTPTVLYTKARKRFWRMFRMVARLSVRALAIARRSPLTRVTPALSIATSAPVPIAIPTAASARAGASLIPSPAIATTCPAA